MVFLFFAFLLSYFFTFYYLCRHENGISVVYATAACGLSVRAMACVSVAAAANLGQMAGGCLVGNELRHVVRRYKPTVG
jgi:hypothetical protein